jgi:hypothetical protein
VHLLMFTAHRIAVVAVLGLFALAASAGALIALTDGGTAVAANRCPRYTPGQIPIGKRCVTVPWLLLEAGPDAKSVSITLAAGCFPESPHVLVRESSTTIRIRVLARTPVPDTGRLATSCVYEPLVALRAPIAGRRIASDSWTGSLHYGSLANHLIGLPRLLGLAPADAIHILWLQGFHAQLAGRGRQVVAQIPGWGLVAPNGIRPDPYRASVTLVAGRDLAEPSPPTPIPGTPSGVLAGALRFVGGPCGWCTNPPSAGVVNVFNAHGALIARPRMRAGQYVRLALAPGLYLLNTDQDGMIDCRPERALVHAGHMRHGRPSPFADRWLMLRNVAAESDADARGPRGHEGRARVRRPRPGSR